MIRLTKFLMLCSLITISAIAQQTRAHQQKEAISTILFNTRSGNLEIAHRFYIHDAEHSAKKLINGKADLISDAAVQLAFAKYVVKHFSIALNSDANLSLKLEGQEVEGKFFWVYQEIANSIKPQQMKVTFDALMEVWPSQRNIVNIEGLGKLRSIELLSSQPSKSVSF